MTLLWSSIKTRKVKTYTHNRRMDTQTYMAIYHNIYSSPCSLVSKQHPWNIHQTDNYTAPKVKTQIHSINSTRACTSM